MMSTFVKIKNLCLLLSAIGIISTQAFASSAVPSLADCNLAADPADPVNNPAVQLVVNFKGGKPIDPTQYAVHLTIGSEIDSDVPTDAVQLNVNGWALQLIVGKGMGIVINPSSAMIVGAIGAGRTAMTCETHLEELK